MDFREKRLVFMSPDDAPEGGAESAASDLDGVEIPDQEPEFKPHIPFLDLYSGDPGEPKEGDFLKKEGGQGTEYQVYNGAEWVTIPPDMIPSDWPHAAPTEAPAVEGPIAVERTEVTAETKAKLVELDTATGLSALREAMGGDFNAVVDILDGKDLKGTINKDQLGEDLIFRGGYEAFLEAIKTKLTGPDLIALRTALKKVFDLTGLEDDDKFKEFLAKLAAVASNDLFKSELEKQYPHIFTFDQFQLPSGVCVLMYDLNFNRENVELKFSLPSGFQKPYEQHALAKEAEVKAAADEKTKADEEATKAADTEEERGEIIKKMKKHPIGGLIVDFFGTAPEGQKSMLDKLIDGEAKFLALLLGAIGVPYFAEKYDSARTMAQKHPRLKQVFDEVDARVKLLKVEAEPETAAATAAAEAPKSPQMDERKFAAVISGGEVPEGGLQLSKQYPLTGKILKVDLHASSLILPKGTSLNIKDKDSISANGNNLELKDQELLLVGAIPAGTIFTKGAKLELVSV